MKQSNSTEQVGVRHSYETYLEACSVTGLIPRKKPIYIDIVNGFFKYIMELVFEGHQVKLLARTGSIYIRGKKEKPRIKDGKIEGLAPDWVKTKKLWESNPEAKEQKRLVYHTNEHTHGIRYKIMWSKKDIATENASFYALKFSWDNKRTVNKLLLEGKEYIVENE